MQSKDRSSDEIFAEPLKVDDVADCYFYHTMELPGHGVINGEWDLRAGVDDYLGKVEFAGQTRFGNWSCQWFSHLRNGKARC